MQIKPFKSAKEIQIRLDKRGDHGYSADPLSLRILGFIAEQLEMLNKPKNKRPSTAWNKFFAAQMKKGSTAKQAAQAWKAKNDKAA